MEALNQVQRSPDEGVMAKILKHPLTCNVIVCLPMKVMDNIKLRVRILRAWLQPLYNNQQVKNMEMIVMDEHNTKMQATVRMDKLNRFKHHLKEGNALTIKRYSRGEIKLKFRMVYNAMRLSFLSNTEVDSCTDFNGSVHGFVWRPFKLITDLEKEEDGQFGKNMLLVKLLRVRILTIMIKMEKQEKKLVTLIDDEDNEIKCTLWGDYAQQFNDFLNSCDDHGKIVLVLQFAMIKFWDAISEDEYKEVEEFRQRLFAKQPSEQSENTSTKISTASKNSTKENFVNRHPI
ncbi:replication protein A 70 kDa DNA-binding subunit B [Tanacetum coccineum]